MGQAKRRGTFEERKAKAILRDEEAFRLKVEKEIARKANMTEEEKRAEFEYKKMLSSYMGFALSNFGNTWLPYKIKNKLL